MSWAFPLHCSSDGIRNISNHIVKSHRNS
ncbi:hypothetical protein Golob_027638 [Gossypium lobatum]|uniref:Uncharacterized protein n=1 Tax=Gossypium lobatum TaxID=34289 RepID=A0A7J8NFI8_9ROSI|nr:hypothetical protein [Gossypium lobatum]